MSRKVSDFLELAREGFHLLAHMLALELHRLANVFAFGKLERESEAVVGIGSRDFRDIVAEGKATIADPSKPLGSNVFVLQGGDEEGFTWEAIGFSSGRRGAVKPKTSIVERITPPPDVQNAIDERMKPGMVLVTTDLPATSETRTGKDFVVMEAPER